MWYLVQFRVSCQIFDRVPLGHLNIHSRVYVSIATFVFVIYYNDIHLTIIQNCNLVMCHHIDNLVVPYWALHFEVV